MLSYLDLVLPEDTWSDAWKAPLARLAEHIGDHALPLVAQIEQLTVIFGAIDQENAPDEYTNLLRAALRMTYETTSSGPPPSHGPPA